LAVRIENSPTFSIIDIYLKKLSRKAIRLCLSLLAIALDFK
jgi:hypothetical protein